MSQPRVELRDPVENLVALYIEGSTIYGSTTGDTSRELGRITYVPARGRKGKGWFGTIQGRHTPLSSTKYGVLIFVWYANYLPADESLF